MKVEVWSAGENGKYGKYRIMYGAGVTILWVILMITILIKGPYFTVNGKDSGIISSIAFTAFFGIISSFLPFIGIRMIQVSKICLARNTKFNLEFIRHGENHSDIDSKNIAYGDAYGIIVCDNKRAYEDWAFFNTITSTRDFEECINVLEANYVEQ